MSGRTSFLTLLAHKDTQLIAVKLNKLQSGFEENNHLQSSRTNVVYIISAANVM